MTDHKEDWDEIDSLLVENTELRRQLAGAEADARELWEVARPWVPIALIPEPLRAKYGGKT